MELKQLLAMQNDLDNYIIKSKHLEGLEPKVRLSNTIHALFVEIGEFSNETRVFKHWSNKGMSDKAIMLEEYVDGLHFFLSIANQLEFSAEDIEKAYAEKWNVNFKRQDNGY